MTECCKCNRRLRPGELEENWYSVGAESSDGKPETWDICPECRLIYDVDRLGLTDLKQLYLTAMSYIDTAMNEVVNNKNQFIYDSLEYNLRQFIAGLGDDLSK